MTWRSNDPIHRFLIRETDTPQFEGGAHRPIHLPEEPEVLKVALGDRPRLSALVPDLLRASGADSTIALVPEGAYWLNNRGLAAYVRRVADSRRVTAILRRVGITDRFQGAFRIGNHEFDSHVTLLASQPFCGGPDVYFAARPAPLLITACREFDLHIETADAELGAKLASVARREGLEIRGLDHADEMPPVSGTF